MKYEKGNLIPFIIWDGGDELVNNKTDILEFEYHIGSLGCSQPSWELMLPEGLRKSPLE